MSELRVNNISDLGSDDVVVNGIIEKAALPSGSILQVISTTKTDTFSATTGPDAFTTVTGLTATITPTSTTSKIFIMVTVVGAAGGVSNTGFQARISGGNTDSYRGNAAGSRVRGVSNSGRGVAASDGSADTIAMTYLDSPSTTSAVTYNVQVSAIGASDVVWVNRSRIDTDNNSFLRGASTITLFEVAG